MPTSTRHLQRGTVHSPAVSPYQIPSDMTVNHLSFRRKTGSVGGRRGVEIPLTAVHTVHEA
jgi:hypothetical protein